jgi:hypothetical protein
MSGEFCRQIASSTLFEGIFYMPQICDGLTSPPKEGMLRIFRPEKSDGFGRVRTRELDHRSCLCDGLVVIIAI